MNFNCFRTIVSNRVKPSQMARATTQLRFMSNKELVINAVGSDRLGIVSDMTKFVTDVGGNVGESQAARLGNNFSLMMSVSVPKNQIDALTERLQGMADMNAVVFEAKEETTNAFQTPPIHYIGSFTLEGADHPGIVHKVTSVLSKNGFSIDKMTTSDDIAPHGGTTLFKMSGIAHAYKPLPADFSTLKIKNELSDLGDALNCDIILEDITDVDN